MTISRCRLAWAFAAGVLLGSAATAAEPGSMVCLGTRAPGAPVVVLEAGAGNGVEAWAKVQPAIAEFARVWAYDRPGLRRHWTNDEAPIPPTPEKVITHSTAHWRTRASVRRMCSSGTRMAA